MQRKTRALGWVALAIFSMAHLIGCGNDDSGSELSCGPGTQDENGICVIVSAGEEDATGTPLTVDATSPTDTVGPGHDLVCGPGTHEEEGVCVVDTPDAGSSTDVTTPHDATGSPDTTACEECGCEPGQQLLSPCGFNGNGTEIAECEDGTWGAFGECDDPDVCENGDEQTTPCGDDNTGQQGQLCQGGQWVDQGECLTEDSCGALSFDGDGDQMQIDWPDFGSDFSPPLTIEAWVNPQTLSGVSSLMHGQDYPFMLEFRDDALTCDPQHLKLNIGSTELCSAEVPLGEWTHVAVTLDANGVGTFWTNGEQSDQTTGLVWSGVGSHVWVGAEDGDHNYFDGQIASIRFSRTVVYDSDFTSPNKLLATAATAALFEFEQDEGAMASDASGEAHSGTIVGATWVHEGPECSN